jgi:hypothetical protein
MQKARAICVSLCFAILVQIITACGGGNNSNQANTNTGSDQDAGTPAENVTAGGMFNTNTPSVQHMQSLNYIAEGQISFGATREVYATSGKYRMQSQLPILSTSH